MNPGAAMRGKPRAHIAIINTEALSELMPVISAPQKFRNLAGQKKQKPERIENIVEEPNHQSTAVALLSCRAESRHPVARAISSITGFLDFARNDGGTKPRWRHTLSRA